MAEYIINSRKYGRQVVLLDDEDYERLQKHKHKLELRYDKTIKGFYVQFKVKPLGMFKTKEEAINARMKALKEVM